MKSLKDYMKTLKGGADMNSKIQTPLAEELNDILIKYNLDGDIEFRTDIFDTYFKRWLEEGEYDDRPGLWLAVSNNISDEYYRDNKKTINKALVDIKKTISNFLTNKNIDYINKSIKWSHKLIIGIDSIMVKFCENTPDMNIGKNTIMAWVVVNEIK